MQLSGAARKKTELHGKKRNCTEKKELVPKAKRFVEGVGCCEAAYYRRQKPLAHHISDAPDFDAPTFSKKKTATV